MADYDWDLDGSDRRRVEEAMRRGATTSSSRWEKMADDPYKNYVQSAQHRYAAAIRSYGMAVQAAGAVLDQGDVDGYEKLRERANEIQAELESLREAWQKERDED